MRPTSLRVGALLGAISSLALTGLLFLGKQLPGFPFVPFDLFDWLARVLPGSLLTFFIDSMVKVTRGLELGPTSDVAKLIEQLMAVAMVVIGGAVFGALIALVLRHSKWSGRRVGSIGGFVLLLVALATEAGGGLRANPLLGVLWLAVTIVGWGALLGGWLDARGRPAATAAEVNAYRASRRAFLLKLAGGSVGLSLVTWGLGFLLKERQGATGSNQPLPETLPPAPPAGAGTPTVEQQETGPAPGSRPDVTANADFYRTDIDLRVPAVAGDLWTLDVKGLFDRPRPLGLSDLMAYPAVMEPRTLCCISNPIGGDLIGNAYWTGLRLRDLLDDLGLRPTVAALTIRATDGFYESVMLEDAMDPRTLLVYGMNGMTLPMVHGFPLRILIPNRYGMKQPKWITHIEATDRPGPGYWVDRGWSKEARPQILSIIDTVARDHLASGRVPVGGIAWAGDRGISKVEVQVDNGPWDEALLMQPLGLLTWVQWRYDWPRVGGRHTFPVRATDGTGVQQTSRSSDPHPNGATGYHAVTKAI